MAEEIFQRRQGGKARSRNSKRPGGAKEIRRLEGENARLKEKLRVAELVIGIQKKYQR